MALLGCLFLLFVCNGAFLWKSFHLEPFLSSYLIVRLFYSLHVLPITKSISWHWLMIGTGYHFRGTVDIIEALP